MKTKRGQTLGEDIGQIIINRNIFDLKITTKDMLSNEMALMCFAQVRKTGLEAMANTDTLSHQSLGAVVRKIPKSFKIA